MKNAIITGPTGAVGMALVQTLIDNKVDVTVICHRGSKRLGQLENIKEVTIVQCNLDELSTLTNILAGKKYDAFFHLAWEGTYGQVRNDCDVQNKNIGYSVEAVRVAKALGCEVFVGAGSQAEYGRVTGSLNSMTPAFPENGYGIAKLAAGQMSRLEASNIGIRHVWGRILSVYGPYDGQYTMIMGTIGKLLEGEVPALTLGEQKWDYLYSADAGEALYRMALKGENGKVYCIGGGKVKPLKEYIEILRDEINPSLELGFGRIPYGEKQVFHLEADITELTKDTGFEPSVSFREGIAKTIAFYKENYYEKN